jgi:lipopolysaccharide transport system permease protein
MSATLIQSPTASVTDVPTEPEPTLHETVIAPKKGWIAVDWGELFRQRELLFFLVWRDIKVRYKQATLGVAWAVLQPLTQVLVFSFIFGSAGFSLAAQLGGRLQHAYPVFIFAGLLPWQLFARSLTEGGLSLVNQQHLLTKIYFPRLFVPTASVGGGLFDMLISFPIFGVMMWIYHIRPPWEIVFLPLLIIVTVMMATGFAYLLAALTVTYRDFRFIIPFVVQLWMWLSFVMIPVPKQLIGRKLGYVVYYANPMYGLISAYRKVLLRDFDNGWNPWSVVISVVAAFVIFFLGIFYFRRTERRFADIA